MTGSSNLTSRSEEETQAIGERLAASLGPGAIVLLVGPLGSGKTVIARGIARGLGIDERITSPSFTIISEYRGRLPFHHVDLYRVDGSEELANLGLDDLLWGDGVSVVEWGEKLEALPGWPAGQAIRIAIAIGPDGARNLCVQGADESIRAGRTAG